MPYETRQTMPKPKVTSGEASGTSCDCNLAVILDEIKGLRKESAMIATEIKEIKAVVNDLRATVEYTQAEVDNIKLDISGVKTQLAEVKATNGSLANEVQLLKSKLLAQERYSRSYNLRIGGIPESQGEDCMSHVFDALDKLGYSKDYCRDQIEIAHQTGGKTPNRSRHIILKCYSRPFRTEVLRSAKRNRDVLKDIYFIEDLTKDDYELKQKALTLMSTTYNEGKKVTFRMGKLIINGVLTPIPVC